MILSPNLRVRTYKALEIVVNEKIEEGWQPHGSLVYDGKSKELCQTMVIY